MQSQIDKNTHSPLSSLISRLQMHLDSGCKPWLFPLYPSYLHVTYWPEYIHVSLITLRCSKKKSSYTQNTLALSRLILSVQLCLKSLFIKNHLFDLCQFFSFKLRFVFLVELIALKICSFEKEFFMLDVSLILNTSLTKLITTILSMCLTRSLLLPPLCLCYAYAWCLVRPV